MLNLDQILEFPNFLSNPGEIRDLFLAGQQDFDLVSLIKRNLGLNLPVILDSGTFKLNLESQESASQAIHIDDYSAHTALIYLTPNPSANSGTQFLKHKETGAISFPTDTEVKAGISRNKLFQDLRISEKWEVYRTVENEYNKLLLFPSYLYHRAGRSFGHDRKTGRLIIYSFFEISGFKY